MAGTRRHTVARLRRCGFSDEILSVYAAMRECESCETWRQLHAQLWRLLSPHRPWHWPAVPRHVGGAAMDGGALADALEEALGSRDSETVKAPGHPPSGGIGWQPDDDEP